MSARSGSTTSEIHVNTNRAKTPVPRTVDTSPVNVQDEYETTTREGQSETIFLQGGSRTNTPLPTSYGATVGNRDTTPLLNGAGNGSFGEESTSDDEDVDTTPVFTIQYLRKNKKTVLRQLKIFLLSSAAFLSIIFIVLYPEHKAAWVQTTVAMSNQTFTVPLTVHSDGVNSESMSFKLRGPFLESSNDVESLLGVLNVEIGDADTHPTNWNITVYLDRALLNNGSNLIEKRNINFKNCQCSDANVSFTYQSYQSEDSNGMLGEVGNGCIPLDYSYFFEAESVREEVCAAVVLILVYGLIIFEIVHRTLAAILGSMAAIAVLSAFGMRPTLEKVMTWLDVETLALLFGMMIIVSIFSETGCFDYCALIAYKLAKGKVWPLITLLCVFSAVVSAFLDNVTTILLLTPVTIRLCEVLNLDPRKILIAEVLFSNIGGTATAIGDPPNVIIVSNSEIEDHGIHFSVFTLHMCIGIVFASLAGYGLLRLFYRKMEDLENRDPVEISELRHEIEMWRRAAMRMVAISREENVMKAIFLQKVAELENKLIKAIYKMKRKKHKNFKEMLSELEKKYRITDYILLAKSGVVLVIVILCFFVHSFIPGLELGLGWISIMGAMLLLVLADMQELETILHRVEWSTLIFFAALFSLMEALNELGLIEFIGDQVTDVISSSGSAKDQLTVAVLLILWVSAIASSFIDNIPYTTAMVPVLLKLNEDTNVPLLPMVLALAYGACLGGNGTLIGASANVVCAGIAEQHGYGFSFMDFFKIGFPMMLVTTVVATGYLMICHVAFQWHPSS